MAYIRTYENQVKKGRVSKQISESQSEPIEGLHGYSLRIQRVIIVNTLVSLERAQWRFIIGGEKTRDIILRR